MKKTLPLIAIVFCSSCTTVDENERGYCLDWKSAPEEVERCIPLYGSLICSTETRTRYWCALWSEDTKSDPE